MNTTGPKINIVVVDKDIEVQDLLQAYFKPKGYNVLQYIDGKSAICESTSIKSLWDILLTDFNFTDVSLDDFKAYMKKEMFHVPILTINAVSLNQAPDNHDQIEKKISFSTIHNEIKAKMHADESPSTTNKASSTDRETKGPSGNIIGCSPRFLLALSLAKRVAKSSANILLFGESGTGKEVFARYIHQQSNRNRGPFVAINCSAIPENLLESELFGHTKGSFTGAQEKRLGLFEEAQDGTLFLDEIGDLGLPLQAKLLRVLQEKQIRRVGENSYRSVNCRIISATHKNLVKEVQNGRFREDLFFRLDVVPISIPPLRERREDLPLLAEAFRKRFSTENETPGKYFSKEAIQYIVQNRWRGNVRELENTIERAVILCDKPEIGIEYLTPGIPDELEFSEEVDPAMQLLDVGDLNVFTVNCKNQLPKLEEVIQMFIEFAVNKKGGARDKTAIEIGIDRKTLYKRMKNEHGR